jgi:predicted CXXCH cytochrome family protein
VLFNFDKTRPMVSTNFLPPEDMTRVTLDSKVTITINDASPMDIVNITEAIILTENSIPVSGIVNYDAISQQITFIPSSPLKPFTRYSVYVNPLLKDKAGNLIYPRNWFFLTLGETVIENPHGNYADNVNVCQNCHSTHRSNNVKLDKPDFPTLPQLDIYCNACHDGTVAPIPDKWNSAKQHNVRRTSQSIISADTCGNCHNPHLSWTASNPNFLQDAYYYTHNDPTNPYLPNSSDEQLCEGCHDGNIKDDPRVTYEIFKYKKRNTTNGTFNDYKLCLRCHDGKNTVDIATYYKTPSGHTISAPADGSPINGAMACSDCHETHGSNNLKLLKEDLGHQNPTTFQTISTEWDVAIERLFCTKCHNNSTIIYGKIVHFNETIIGHEITNNEFCNQCHGGGSAIKAAHGPVKP